MGFLNRLIGSTGGGSEPPCPSCGATLDGEELIEGSYWCDSCGLVITDGGELINVKPGDERIMRPSRSSDGGDSCEACQASLAGAERYLPYENGSNPDAYIECRSCGHENVRHGFGEDPD